MKMHTFPLFAILFAFLTPIFGQIGTIQPGVYNTFESPQTPSYAYNPPLTILNPWTFTSGRGGIASSGSPFQPGVPQDPPSPNQFAFIQITNDLVSNMSTTLNGLTIGSSYTLEFFYSVRRDTNDVGVNTTSRLSVYYGSVALFQSPQNISVLGGWVPVRLTFVAAAASGPLVFNNVAILGADRTLLIDSVSVQALGFTPAQYSIPFGSTHSFESPSVNASTYGTGLSMQIYSYTPGTSPSQPFVWSSGLGGVALIGSPFDTAAPNTPPDGRQYAFLQTSPNGRLGLRSSYLNSSFSGLTVGSSYFVSFYWSVRRDGAIHDAGLRTETQITVRMSDTVVFVSAQNLTVTGGWFRNTSNSFVATATTMPISFNLNSLSDHDHSILFDAVSLSLTTSSSTGPSGLSSSSSVLVPQSSSTGPILLSSSARSSSSSAVSSSSASSSVVPSSTVAPTSSSSVVSSTAPAATSSPVVPSSTAAPVSSSVPVVVSSSAVSSSVAPTAAPSSSVVIPVTAPSSSAAVSSSAQSSSSSSGFPTAPSVSSTVQQPSSSSAVVPSVTSSIPIFDVPSGSILMAMNVVLPYIVNSNNFSETARRFELDIAGNAVSALGTSREALADYIHVTRLGGIVAPAARRLLQTNTQLEFIILGNVSRIASNVDPAQAANIAAQTIVVLVQNGRFETLNSGATVPQQTITPVVLVVDASTGVNENPDDNINGAASVSQSLLLTILCAVVAVVAAL